MCGGSSQSRCGTPERVACPAQFIFGDFDSNRLKEVSYTNDAGCAVLTNKAARHTMKVRPDGQNIYFRSLLYILFNMSGHA